MVVQPQWLAQLQLRQSDRSSWIESELRIEVGNDSPLRLRLLSGNAEIFGTELPPEIWLTLPPRLKIAVSFNELGFPVAQFDLLKF